MKKIAIILTLCFCFLGLNSVKADVSTETSSFHRLMKTYRESFISNNASYGYHGTDYSVNSPIEVYAEIAVKGLNTKREYGTAHAKVEAPSFALKGADHTHRWG